MTTTRKIIDLIIVLVIAVVTFGSIYLYYSGRVSFNKPVRDAVVMPPVPGLFTKPFYEDLNLPKPEILPENFAENSYVYTNKQFGFSLSLPNASMNYFGNCTQSGSQAVVHSGNTPVKVFESGSTVYIGNSYTYETDDHTCTKIEVIPDHPSARWKIDYFKAFNEAEVNAWIVNNIGQNCKITSKKSWLHNSAIDSYEFNRDYETCPYNPYELLYNPKTNRAYLFTFGPEATFWRDEAASLFYDNDVLSSLSFY